MLSQCPWFGAWSPWFMLVPLGIFAMFLVAVLVLWRHGGTLCGPWGQHHSPLDILKERYAKGEINKDEFDRMKKDIQGQANHTPNGPVEEIFRWQRMRPLPTKVVAGASFVSAAEQERS